MKAEYNNRHQNLRDKADKARATRDIDQPGGKNVNNSGNKCKIP